MLKINIKKIKLKLQNYLKKNTLKNDVLNLKTKFNYSLLGFIYEDVWYFLIGIGLIVLIVILNNYNIKDIIKKKLFMYFYKNINLCAPIDVDDYEPRGCFGIDINKNDKLVFPESFYFYHFYKYCLKIHKIELTLNPYTDKILDIFLKKIMNPEKMNKADYANFIDLLLEGLMYSGRIDDDINKKKLVLDSFEKALYNARYKFDKFFLNCSKIKLTLNRDFAEYNVICECVNLILFAEYEYIVKWLKYYYFNNKIEFRDHLSISSIERHNKKWHPPLIYKYLDEKKAQELNSFYLKIKDCNSFIFKASFITGDAYSSHFSMQEHGFARDLTSRLWDYKFYFLKTPLDIFKISDIYYDLKFFIEFFWKYAKDSHDHSRFIQDAKLLQIIENCFKAMDKSFLSFIIYIITLKKGPILFSVLMSGFHGFFGLSFNFWHEMFKKIPESSNLKNTLIKVLHKNNKAGFVVFKDLFEFYNKIRFLQNTKQIDIKINLDNLFEDHASLVEQASVVATYGDFDKIARPSLMYNYKEFAEFKFESGIINFRSVSEIIHTGLVALENNLKSGPSATADGSGYKEQPCYQFQQSLYDICRKSGKLDVYKEVSCIQAKGLGPGMSYDMLLKDNLNNPGSEAFLVLKPEINIQLKQFYFKINDNSTVYELYDFLEEKFEAKTKRGQNNFSVLEWELKSSKGIPLKFVLGTELVRFENYYAGFTEEDSMHSISWSEGKYNQELMDSLYKNDNITFASLFEKYSKGDVMYTVELYLKYKFDNYLDNKYKQGRPAGLEIKVGFGVTQHDFVDNLLKKQKSIEKLPLKGALALKSYDEVYNNIFKKKK